MYQPCSSIVMFKKPLALQYVFLTITNELNIKSSKFQKFIIPELFDQLTSCLVSDGKMFQKN